MMREFERQLDTYIKDVRLRYEDMLGQAVEIPSISMDPKCPGYASYGRTGGAIPARCRRGGADCGDRRAIRWYRVAG